MILKKVVCDLEKGRCCVSVNFGLCRPCAIGTGERRNKTCQLLINLVSFCVLKLDNASPKQSRKDSVCMNLLPEEPHCQQ